MSTAPGPSIPKFIHRLVVKVTECSPSGEVIGHRFHTVDVESDTLTRALFDRGSHTTACVVGCESRRAPKEVG